MAILSVEDPRVNEEGGVDGSSKGIKPCWAGGGGGESDCLGLMTALGAFEYSGERFAN